MPEYHVGAGMFAIYCGTWNKPLKDGSVAWRNRTECTDEAICAVRDYLKTQADINKLSKNGYEWTTKDGNKVRLILEIEKAMEDTEND